MDSVDEAKAWRAGVCRFSTEDLRSNCKRILRLPHSRHSSSAVNALPVLSVQPQARYTIAASEVIIASVENALWFILSTLELTH